MNLLSLRTTSSTTPTPSTVFNRTISTTAATRFRRALAPSLRLIVIILIDNIKPTIPRSSRAHAKSPAQILQAEPATQQHAIVPVPLHAHHLSARCHYPTNTRPSLHLVGLLGHLFKTTHHEVFACPPVFDPPRYNLPLLYLLVITTTYGSDFGASPYLREP